MPRQTREQFEASMVHLREQPFYSALVEFEQRMWRSQATHECAGIECYSPGVEWSDSVLIKSAKGYWHCAECAAHWRSKEE